jgi:hypothetical protein
VVHRDDLGIVHDELSIGTKPTLLRREGVKTEREEKEADKYAETPSFAHVLPPAE